MVPLELISQIYEATAAPDLWPSVLESVANAIGALGACFVHRSGEEIRWVVNPRMEAFAAAYGESGWPARDDRITAVVADHHPGFRVDADYWTEEQLCNIPVYRDFLLPRGMKASGASLIQGSRDDMLHVGIEGLPSYATAHDAVPLLDALRPHLARALSFSAQMSQVYDKGVVNGLNAAGIGAAVVGHNGRLRAANEIFGQWFGGDLTDIKGSIRIRDAAANQLLQAALSSGSRATREGRSFPVSRGEGKAVLHCIPVKGRSQDVFESDGMVLMLAHPNNRMIPTSDLLRLLFDLTPAEANMARLFAQGKTLPEISAEIGIKQNTARAHLKSIFNKTGFSRQSQLAVTLHSLGIESTIPSTPGT